MAGEKGLGSKILGIFVERPGDDSEEDAPASPPAQQEKSAADLVAEIARAAAPPPTDASVPASAHPASATTAGEVSAPIPPGAPVDFDAIFRDFGMDVADLDRVKKAEDLLLNLPAQTPLIVQKQIVEAALKAFGYDLAKIVGAAQNQRRALDTYVKVNESSNAKANEDAEAQIKALRDQIASLRSEIDQRTQGQIQLTAAAQQRKVQIQRILAFFEPPAAVAPPSAPETPPGPQG
ncbi:MAG: hypothetical protein HY901_21170 [Deltaproteobacteria bacterium]|nr:hypothetical protein [Deltaproteobacteria bacterium]